MRQRRPSARVLLVSAYPRHHYSGMVPGYLAGSYREEEIAFDLAAQAAAAGAQFLCDEVSGLDPQSRRLVTRGHGTIEFDRVSFNIGSRAAGWDLPSVRRHAQLVKPISRAVQLRQRTLTLGRSGEEVHVSVVGAGAAGVEVALALRRLLEEQGARPRITLWEASATILDGYPEHVRRRANRILARAGVEVRTEAPVAAVGPSMIEPERGDRQPADLTVWLAGPAAPPLFRDSGLPVDARGFLLVDPTLRSVGDERIFGAGDCVTPAEDPGTPKAGVYAVREAPVLSRNLEAVLGGAAPAVRYRPQEGFLSILNTSDGKALLHYRGLVSHSRWAWRLKDWIDRRFVSKYE